MTCATAYVRVLAGPTALDGVTAYDSPPSLQRPASRGARGAGWRVRPQPRTEAPWTRRLSAYCCRAGCAGRNRRRSVGPTCRTAAIPQSVARRIATAARVAGIEGGPTDTQGASASPVSLPPRCHRDHARQRLETARMVAHYNAAAALSPIACNSTVADGLHKGQHACPSHAPRVNCVRAIPNLLQLGRGGYPSTRGMAS